MLRRDPAASVTVLAAAAKSVRSVAAVELVVAAITGKDVSDVGARKGVVSGAAGKLIRLDIREGDTSAHHAR